MLTDLRQRCEAEQTLRAEADLFALTHPIETDCAFQAADGKMPAPHECRHRPQVRTNPGGADQQRRAAIIQGGRKGVEKESLRVTPDGRIAQTPHPRALGSALTNEHITTDYSEALIELVSPTFRTSWELLQYLLDLHQFVYQHLGDELLWATSMPSIIDGDAEHSHRAVRQLERRPHEDRVPRGARAALRPHDAGHLRRAFQLLVPGGHVGPMGGSRAVARSAARISSPNATSTCCATTAATAGSCCTCSACRRWCATASCAAAT